MNREDVIRTAREAGWTTRDFDGEPEVMCCDNYHIQTDTVELFAALIAAAEREACARQLDGLGNDHCAAAIRARGEKDAP